jgi:hypothetical protein
MPAKKLTASRVAEVVATSTEGMQPHEVRDTLSAQGFDATAIATAVRQALDEGKVKLGAGLRLFAAKKLAAA